MKTQLFTIGAAIATAVLTDFLAYIRSRKEAVEADKEIPPYIWERLAERILAGAIVGLTGAGLATYEQ